MASTTEVISSASDLLASHSALISRIRQSQLNHRRQLRALPSPPHELLRLPLIPSPAASPSPSPPSSPKEGLKPPRADLPPAKRARVARYANYVPEEETIRNDYSQQYVDGGEWPQNWVLGAEPENRFEEYPKQQRLLALKKASVNAHSLPPTYLPFAFLSSLPPTKFDVILLDPPFSSSFGWDQLQELPVPSLAADPSFVFMWVGSGAGEGLERGREVLGKWGYRRCEDVVWVKTNKTSNKGPGTDPPTTSLLTRTKQHCLIGIRGTVRRSTDSWFVHCNVDTDVIIWEGDPSDPTRKPPEMYTLIENFCLGTRRLEIFGRARSSLRRGWVTALVEGDEAHVNGGEMAPDLEMEGSGGAVEWEKEKWEAGIRNLAGMNVEGQAGLGLGGQMRAVVPNTPEIDALRPKSPVRGGSSNLQGGMSGGVSMGIVRGQGGAVGFMGNVGAPMMGQNQMMMGVGAPMMAMGMPMNAMGMDPSAMFGMGGGMGLPGMGMGMGMMGMPSMPGGQNMGMMGMGGSQPGFGMGMVGGGVGWGDGQGQIQVPQGQMSDPSIWGTGSEVQGMMGMGMGESWGQGGSTGYEGY